MSSVGTGGKNRFGQVCEKKLRIGENRFGQMVRTGWTVGENKFGKLVRHGLSSLKEQVEENLLRTSLDCWCDQVGTAGDNKLRTIGEDKFGQLVRTGLDTHRTGWTVGENRF